MADINPTSLYGRLAFPLQGRGIARTFFLVSSSSALYPSLQSLYPVGSEDGVARIYTSWTAVLAACTAGRADTIVVCGGFSTAQTAAELLSAETKGVRVINDSTDIDGSTTVYRATAALPQSTAAALFTVTGRIKLLSIIGEVTTAIQNQANNTKLIANPSLGGASDVDICAVLNIANDAVGTNYFITGTLATALQDNASGVGVFQAAPLIIPAGTIDLSCSASNTGSVKWQVKYIPIDPGAVVVAA